MGRLPHLSLIEGLEMRSLMAFTPGGPVDGSRVTEFRTDNSGSGIHVGGGLGRTGAFDLPTVGADGSVNLVGSSEADNITAERVVGIDELARSEYGAPMDAEYDFVLLLNDSGEYVQLNMGSADARGIADQQRLHKARMSSMPDVVGSWENDTSEQGKTNYRTSSELYAKEQRDDSVYTNLSDRITNGTFVHYTLEGVYDFYVEVNPNATAKTKLTIDAGAGADNVNISSNVPLRTNLSGGSGADKLTSGKKIANLFGGGGNDLLVSRSTKGGTLEGGKGSDRYVSKFSDVNIQGRGDGDRVLAGAQSYGLLTSALVKLDLDETGFSFRSVDNVDPDEETFKIVFADGQYFIKSHDHSA